MLKALRSETPERDSLMAVKILTGHATTLNKRGQFDEAAMLRKAAALDKNAFLPFLMDDFEILGPHGTHIALVLTLLTTDIGQFRRTAPNQRLPLHTVKMIISCVMSALVELHSLDIIHTSA